MIKFLAFAGLTLAVACSESGGGGGSGGSSAGGSGGRGGSGGSTGSGGSSAGSGGATGGSGGATGGSGGAPGGSGGSGGSGGATGGSGGSGGATGGSGGSGGSGGATGGSGGSMGDARPSETGGADTGGNASNRILFYTRSTSNVHAPAVTASVAEMMKLLAASGLTADAIDNPAMITSANLAKYAGVVMVNNGSQPFGNPGTAQTQALVDFVRGGGGLAAFHATSVTGDMGPIGQLLGANRTDPGGDFRTTDCTPEAGAHPTVAKLPMPYRVMNEEYYTFTGLNPANQVVLRCNAATGTDKLPISWVREEGAGRVFFTGLGHYAAFWTGGRFLSDHAWPGVLWTIKK